MAAVAATGIRKVDFFGMSDLAEGGRGCSPTAARIANKIPLHCCKPGTQSSGPDQNEVAPAAPPARRTTYLS